MSNACYAFRPILSWPGILYDRVVEVGEVASKMLDKGTRRDHLHAWEYRDILHYRVLSDM
jgi:hypothetical protein